MTVLALVGVDIIDSSHLVEWLARTELLADRRWATTNDSVGSAFVTELELGRRRYFRSVSVFGIFKNRYRYRYFSISYRRRTTSSMTSVTQNIY